MTAAANATVLHVEDDAVNRQSLGWVLRAEGFRVLEAGTGTDALQLVDRQQPDLIVLDVGLPDMSGFEVCRRIKADPTTAAIPILQLSGHFVDARDRVQGLETGADAYLMKPVDPRELVAHLRALLRVHRAERAARAAAQQWQLTFDAVSDGICVLNTQGRVIRCNRAMASVFGQPASQVVGRDLAELYTRLGGAPASWLADAGRGEVHEVAFRGRWFRVRLDAAPELGTAAGKVLVWVDITEHRQAERTLRAILETSGDAVLVLDAGGGVRHANPATERLFGYGAAELAGRSLDELLAAPAPDTGGAGWPAAVQAVRVTARRKDGTTFPAELTVGAMPLDPERLFAAFVHDLTERNRLEDQLRQAVKMEAVGRLAGGIAHDFNNQLTIINGYADLLLGSLPAEDPSRDFLGEIRRSGEHAADLTRQLLAFSRKQHLTPRVLNLNTVLGELGKMLRRLLGADVELRTDLDPALGPVRADAGQLEQVLVNLAVNARDSMPGGGRLEIRTRNRDVATAAEVPAGEYVLLEVADTGAGMSEEVRSCIFEPFFTTKEVGKGTGLGLATVYGIVKQSGGHIEVDSAPGRGTTFRVLLPRVDQAALFGVGPAEVFQVPRGTETILLVEDEAGVRGLASIILRSCGYEVLEAADGPEAVRLCEGRVAEIDLLVTDVVMPRMNGPQLADRLRRLRPALRVLFVSGYTDDAIVPTDVLAAGQAFLHKPFTPARLAGKVRQVLDATSKNEDLGRSRIED
jgi:PAS domain S-box-containing protein